MSDVLRILHTAAVAAPFLLIAALLEGMVTDDGPILKIFGADIMVIVICLAILSFEYLKVLWS